MTYFFLAQLDRTILTIACRAPGTGPLRYGGLFSASTRTTTRFLAVACRRHLAWHARKTLFSHDALISWSQATAELLQNGAFRLSSALERAGGAKASRPSLADDKKKSARRIAWQLAAVAGGVAILAAATNESWKLGFNLFTAQAVVVGMTLFELWRCSLPSQSSKS